MLSPNLVKGFNDQIALEFHASHYYYAMANWCKIEDLDGASIFFTQQSDEERQHAYKFIDFLYSMDAIPVIPAIDQPKAEYSDILEILETSLKQEKKVTASIQSLMDLAQKENSHAANPILTWFIDEQIEEEDSFRSLISKAKRLGNTGMGLHLLDEHLGSFNATAQEDV